MALLVYFSPLALPLAILAFLALPLAFLTLPVAFPLAILQALPMAFLAFLALLLPLLLPLPSLDLALPCTSSYLAGLAASPKLDDTWGAYTQKVSWRYTFFRRSEQLCAHVACW